MICNSCMIGDEEKEKSKVKLNVSKSGFHFNEVDYSMENFAYDKPQFMTIDIHEKDDEHCLRCFGCLSITRSSCFKGIKKDLLTIKLRRFYRPDYISSEKAYVSDIQ